MYFPAIAHRSDGVRERQRPGSNVGRIFAETVPGHECRLYPFLSHHTPRRDRCSQNRRLRDFREPKFFFRPFETELRELVSERVVCFVEGGARDSKLAGEFFAHADGLGTLSGKEEC